MQKKNATRKFENIYEGNIKIIDKLELEKIKTRELGQKIKKLGIESATFLDTDKINKNFQLSIRNLKNCDLISCKGINAALVLKRKTLVISRNAVKQVEEVYK